MAFFFQVVRSKRLAGPPPRWAREFKCFPVDAMPVTVDNPLPAFGKGKINPAASDPDVQGVRFIAGTGIGNLLDTELTVIPPNSIPTAIPRGQIAVNKDNNFVALLENTGPQAVNVTAEVRIANWGVGNLWAHPDNMTPVLSPSIPLAAQTGANPVQGFTINKWPSGFNHNPAPDGTISSWMEKYRPPEDATHRPHQCIWVEIRADANSNISQSSMRRNMDFAKLSDVERTAEIGGHDYPEPADGSGQHEILLFSRCRKIVVQELVDQKNPDEIALEVVGRAVQLAEGAGQSSADHVGMATKGQPIWKDSVVYLWITEAFRRTGELVTIDGIESEAADNSAGDFGLIAYHEGVDDNVSWSFDGPGVVNLGNGAHSVKVPHKGSVPVKIKLAASSDGPKGDISGQPPANDVDKPHTKTCLMALLALLVLVIIIWLIFGLVS